MGRLVLNNNAGSLWAAKFASGSNVPAVASVRIKWRREFPENSVFSLFCMVGKVKLKRPNTLKQKTC
jgi:hypothetical protein